MVETNCFSTLTINSDGFVDGIENCMRASNDPAIYQILELLPKIQAVFPEAKGITYQERYKISMEGEILEDSATNTESVKPNEKELAKMHGLSISEYQTLVDLMQQPIETWPAKILLQLQNNKIGSGSLQGVDEVITSWLKGQRQSDK